MDDNGSGVTAVLEVKSGYFFKLVKRNFLTLPLICKPIKVARAMTEGGCRPKHSIIFVAFDLEEVGCVGSIFFVRDFLIEQVLKPHGAKLKGAFILDTIMNYNETRMSQTLSPEWQKALPEFWEDVKVLVLLNKLLLFIKLKFLNCRQKTKLETFWQFYTEKTWIPF